MNLQQLGQASPLGKEDANFNLWERVWRKIDYAILYAYLAKGLILSIWRFVFIPNDLKCMLWNANWSMGFFFGTKASFRKGSEWKLPSINWSHFDCCETGWHVNPEKVWVREWTMTLPCPPACWRVYCYLKCFMCSLSTPTFLRVLDGGTSSSEAEYHWRPSAGRTEVGERCCYVLFQFL